MDSQATRELQVSLYASISTLSIVKDLGIADDTSLSFTSLSADLSETFTFHNFDAGIPLHITGWSRFAGKISQASDRKECAHSICEFFVGVGKAHRLENTPCITILQEAIAACDHAPSTSSVDQLTGMKKVVQKTRNQAPLYVSTLRGFSVESPPPCSLPLLQ